MHISPDRDTSVEQRFAAPRLVDPSPLRHALRVVQGDRRSGHSVLAVLAGGIVWALASICSCLPSMVSEATAGPQEGNASDRGRQAVSRVTLSKGWATFGLALPPGSARSGVQVGRFETQTDIKNRWTDGSIRFAAVTCKASEAGDFAVIPTSAVSGRLVAKAPGVSVEFNVGGTIFTASPAKTPTADLWLSGPLVQEWRCVVAPVHDSTPHKQLRVVFDIRVYRDGQARLDVTAENVLDARPASTVRYSVQVKVDGKSIYSHGAMDHIWLARWRRTFDIGLLKSSVTHDFTSAITAYAIPRYWNGIVDTPTPTMKTGFDLMELANMTPSMCDCGGRAEMAPYPNWAAEYLVHRGAQDAAYVLAHGEQAASWPMHLREPEGGRHSGVGAGRYTSLDERPKFWFDNRGEDHPKGRTNIAYALWGKGVPVPDIAHQPSLAFIPYLLTGDRYFMDEMVFWANFCLIASYEHGGSQGLIHHNELRGMAWAVRNLTDAAAFAPDKSSVKTYLTKKLENNLAWFDTYAASHASPLGSVFGRQGIPSHDQYTSASYGGGYGQLAWALDRAGKLGFRGGTRMRDKLSLFVLKLFSSEPDFPRNAAMRLWLHVGPKGKGKYYKTMAMLAAANKGGDSMYAHWVRLALVIAIDNGFPDAQEAYEYNWKICATGKGNGGIKLSNQGGWALLPAPAKAAARR